MRNSYYDVAQVCPNGHVASSMAETCPQHRKPFCDKCGEATITSCPKCDARIRGYYHVPGVMLGHNYDPPGFCLSCGSPFPWTERKQQAAIDLFIEETQDQEARREFKESVEQIAKDTPQAQVASLRITRLLEPIGKFTAQAIRDILVDVASEMAKKFLIP
ncbi:DUF2321 domain-containing protein [Tuwongella immobilis]|uniref:DUF2321 domain-containing protein n=1 Tax=Tuwongella immobilis TaxID=692036 RepID=A0A6C2YL05_9BACT|nr:DUF2321 domain-containing protein [Tuwongella immobilis]VIP01785.1 Uncharacterized protein OS=Pseudomonas monteilii SB3078 GN=X969_18685 PE=4 SV=1: DUF2321 [Tuwongella immobilis]VTR99442.1 Uncharacterized protein OS=Pseudomonas monteilii SB3078 GN=X969_18685 PE=4 SV=1: DUF2321 [Tuwongella immobilis]